jgi:hypothetical protein
MGIRGSQDLPVNQIKNRFMRSNLLVLIVMLVAAIVRPVPVCAAAPSAEAAVDSTEAAQFFDSRDEVRVSAVPMLNRVAPGSQVFIAVIFDHNKGWHIHTNSPVVPPELGDPESYIKTVVKVSTEPDNGLTIHNDFIDWPEPITTTVRFLENPVPYAVFAEEAIAFVPVTVAPDARLGSRTIYILATFQACDEHLCLRPVFDLPLDVTLEVVPPAQAQSSAEIDPTIFGGSDPGIWDRIAKGDTGPKIVAFDVFGLGIQIDAAGAVGLILLLLLAALGACFSTSRPASFRSFRSRS